MVELALLLAITIIMGTTPLGTIRTPFLSISLVTIPVAIGAILSVYVHKRRRIMILAIDVGNTNIVVG